MSNSSRKNKKEVLLLNTNYKPLHLVTLGRSLSLIESEKVRILEDDGLIKSGDKTYIRPDVIVLKEYRKVPYKKEYPVSKKILKIRDNYECQYCEAPGDSLDHVRPLSKGGRHCWENIVLSCKRCNSLKANKLLSELKWRIKSTPRKPESIVIVFNGKIKDSWRRYA